MTETFAQYLERWLKQSTKQGLTNPLVKMPIKRFRALDVTEFKSVAGGGSLVIGTMADPISRNLFRNFQGRIRERGEHCGFICSGSVELSLAGAVGQQPRTALFPVCLKRASLQNNGDKIKVVVSEDESWKFNPVLEAHLSSLGIHVPSGAHEEPQSQILWLRAQLGNRATQVGTESYVGLFSSQQMVVQERLTDPFLRRALAQNVVVRAKIAGSVVDAIELGETSDEGIEEAGLVLPCDDSQLRVIQLSHQGYSLQVEGPPGTGKSQTIANIISNALYTGKSVLLVCDKKAAINQVEERLTGCGLGPALLNLHDEDLDKREFLKQATATFPSDDHSAASRRMAYPFEQLAEARKVLNDRVKFGRAVAHSSLQVANRHALAGMIQLKKELGSVPAIPIPNYQSLSKERLSRLLHSLAEWPGMAAVLRDSENIWNSARVESFDENPNAVNEIRKLVEQVLFEIAALDELRECAVTVGITLPIKSDQDIARIATLVHLVLNRPACHPKIIGNADYSLAQVDNLASIWQRRAALVSARHPALLENVYSPDLEREARDLLKAEQAESWQSLSDRVHHYREQQRKLDDYQARYSHLCNHLGLVYTSETTVRRAQLHSVSRLGASGVVIPGSWWNEPLDPVLMISGWGGRLNACIEHSRTSLIPLRYTELERVALTHWKHIETMAEHGFGVASACIRFIDTRKCRYALRQAYAQVPDRGFTQWNELTLHAVAGVNITKSLRSAAEVHPVLKQVTENYLSAVHGTDEQADRYFQEAELIRLRVAAALVGELRGHDDMFEVGGLRWKTFWEAPNQVLVAQCEALDAELDTIDLPAGSNGNIDEAVRLLGLARKRIETFLETCKLQAGDLSNSVLATFEAQRAFASCQSGLTPLGKYLALHESSPTTPNWPLLRGHLTWRDKFEEQCGNQRLDIDSALWLKLENLLHAHQQFMEKSCREYERFFDRPVAGVLDYDAFCAILRRTIEELPRHALWLEKRRWRGKIGAYPEIEALWEKVLAGDVPPQHSERLFCFNLLRLCEPIAKPHGPELAQVLGSFARQDESLTHWVLDHMKLRLRKIQLKAASNASQSQSELGRLAGLQRIRGTVRELVNGHLDYLLGAKPCWLMSPTSLANLVSSDAFRNTRIPFDVVIFDEASQIRVLDGLLAMAFAKQVIVVGDKNQLPPTDFFGSFSGHDANAENEDLGLSESLLDEFAGVFTKERTHVTLMSHYRSETPDLIRFSNDMFYDGRLEMYPPQHISGVGRRLHYVPGAIYSETAGQRTNPVEAQAVVNLIEAHIKEWPDKSLGVVTKNIPQMELIDEYLQLFKAEDVREFCADESRFFLRNLETVQGDEMDRIILSLTYGRNSSGQFNAAVLGPLTKSGGERRLNVAITRSRSGMTIVTSLKAADLEASGAQSKGFQCLKELLLDLEASQHKRSFGIGNRRFEKRTDGVSSVVYCESPFEEQVVEFLENEGYEVECQYGAGRFRLDIVVKEGGKNLLAIECDGAGYHSSLVARTRDRARQRNLEAKGWRFHRVWSTNWWYFEVQEKEAIISAINSARIALGRNGTPGKDARSG